LESMESYDLPLKTTTAELREILKAVTKDGDENDYTFYYGATEVTRCLT
jgi:NAD(P)H-flavin reductase